MTLLLQESARCLLPLWKLTGSDRASGGDLLYFFTPCSQNMWCLQQYSVTIRFWWTTISNCDRMNILFCISQGYRGKPQYFHVWNRHSTKLQSTYLIPQVSRVHNLIREASVYTEWSLIQRSTADQTTENKRPWHSHPRLRYRLRKGMECF